MSRRRGKESPKPASGGEFKVGPGNPPPEYRWPKGYCPNPKGRPKKKEEEMKNPTKPTPIQQEILDFSRAVVGEINGEAVTNLDTVLRTMKVLMQDKPEFGKLLLKEFMQAAHDEQEFKMVVLREALAHKAEWGSRFDMAKSLGQALPDVHPHPDDIIIRADNSVTFDGPITASDAKQLKRVLNYRDALFFVAQETIDWVGSVYSIQEGRCEWQKLRRKYYRISPRIPRRLQKPFPPFVPELAE